MGDRLATIVMGWKVEAAVPLSVWQLGPHLTPCHLGRGRANWIYWWWSNYPSNRLATIHYRQEFAKVSQTRQQISAANGPMFTIFWEYLGETLLFNNFFPIVDVYSCEDKDIAPTKFCDGAQLATFWRFFGPCISSELRAAAFRPAS